VSTVKTQFELVTFDAYMALTDIGGTLTPQVAEEFGLSSGVASEFVALWRGKQMERAASSNAMALGHVPFAECTAMALNYALAKFELQCGDTERLRLVALWGQLEPWPEANSVIAALNNAGVATAILSNGDQAVLEAMTTRFTARFDYVLSAQTAGKYKPHPAIYALPETVLDIERSRVLHVAGSPNDVLGAVACGLPCVWSNRSAEALVDIRYPPRRICADLNGVIEYVNS